MKDNPEVNQEFASAIEPYVKIAIFVLILIGVLVDIILYKHRKYANYLLYYELVSTIVQGFVPFNYGDFRNLFLIFIML